MKITRCNTTFLLLICALLTLIVQSCNQEGAAEDEEDHEVEEAVQHLSPESIYQLDGEWHTQNNDTVQLSQLQGKIPVVAMVFTNCGFACPRIVADLKNIEEQLPKEKIDEVVFVLVSFDTERDHSTRLQEFAREMDLQENWLLLNGEEEEIRELTMVLDVQYSKQPDGNFAHSNNIILLDKNGVIVTKVEGLKANAQPIVDQIKQL